MLANLTKPRFLFAVFYCTGSRNKIEINYNKKLGDTNTNQIYAGKSKKRGPSNLTDKSIKNLTIYVKTLNEDKSHKIQRKRTKLQR